MKNDEQTSGRRSRKRKAGVAAQVSVLPAVDAVPLDRVTFDQADTGIARVTASEPITQADLAALDAQLLSAAAQLTAVRSEIVRLKRMRQDAAARHAAGAERRALQRFAAGEVISDEDFALVTQAVQRDPRAQVVPPDVRAAFHAALGAGQELGAMGVALDVIDGCLVPTLLDGYHPTPEQQHDIDQLLAEVQAAEIITREGAPQKG